MTTFKTAAAVCTSLAVTAGCARQTALEVPEVTRNADGRYTLTIEDRPGGPPIVPEHIITAEGVFRRAPETDVNKFIEKYVGWPTAPENKLEAFGSIYYKLDTGAARAVIEASRGSAQPE